MCGEKVPLLLTRSNYTTCQSHKLKLQQPQDPQKKKLQKRIKIRKEKRKRFLANVTCTVARLCNQMRQSSNATLMDPEVRMRALSAHRYLCLGTRRATVEKETPRIPQLVLQIIKWRILSSSVTWPQPTANSLNHLITFSVIVLEPSPLLPSFLSFRFFLCHFPPLPFPLPPHFRRASDNMPLAPNVRSILILPFFIKTILPNMC